MNELIFMSKEDILCYRQSGKSADENEDDLKKLMVGREVTGDYYRSDYGEKVSDEVVLSVKNVQFRD